MGSIFTYETEERTVSSPWLLPADESDAAATRTPALGPGLLSEYGVTKLVAEPQDGPTEYKLHLLLRPRRPYLSMSTTDSPAPILSSSNQSRQSRLQHLTTQLLWRLRQSLPFHSSTTKDLVLPQLPDDNVDLGAVAVRRGKLVSGLEESRGSLYEIGVSDDGTLVGLTKDEMDESIATLRVMAASLGCRVEIVRMIIVGECEWLHGTTSRRGNLWVSEALVAPDLNPQDDDHAAAALASDVPSRGCSTTDQLRITLTGPTTSGKSTLLGTLATGTLDNGRGVSRLSMLKHRHEVLSGVTSSVAQELIGYKDKDIFNYSHGNIESWVDMHDFAEGGRLVLVSDSAGHPRYRHTVLRGLVGWDPHWTVLCIAADDGDAAAAAASRDALGTAGEAIDLAQAHLDLCLGLRIPLAVVVTKLDLATRPGLHRAVSKILTSVKNAGRTPKLVHPDQKPQSSSSQPVMMHVPGEDHAKIQAVVDAIGEYGNGLSCVPILLTSAVKGSGIGLVHALLESLPLPARPTASDFVGLALNPEQPKTLFHIDDTFDLPSPYMPLAGSAERQRVVVAHTGVVVTGYLRFGSLAIGDRIVVGPFPSSDDDSGPGPTAPSGGWGLSISHPSSVELARIAMHNAVSASAIRGEWHDAQIVSVRNLRLPVLRLEAGQAGSVGIVLDGPAKGSSGGGGGGSGSGGGGGGSPPNGSPSQTATRRIRKGMVLAVPSSHMTDTGLSLQAASGLTASFSDSEIQSLSIGSLVNIYVASVRAAARVLRISSGSQSAYSDPTSRTAAAAAADDDDDNNDDDDGGYDDTDCDVFGLGERQNAGSGTARTRPAAPGGSGLIVHVSLELLTNREWIEMGSRILVLEGGRRDRSGLEGYLGNVIEIVD